MMNTTRPRNALLLGLLSLGLSAPAEECGRSQSTVVPAQIFKLRDSGGQLLANISFEFTDGARSAELSLFKGDAGIVDEPFHDEPFGHTLAAIYISPGSWRGRESELTLFEPDAAGFLKIHVLPVLAFDHMSSSANTVFRRGQGARTNMSRFEMGTAIGGGLVKQVFHSVSPPTPHPSLDELIPTQDIRFVDKNKQSFMTTGLSHDTEPSVAIFNQQGRLTGVITMTRFNGFDISMFDGDGDRRVWTSQDLRSNSVVLTEDIHRSATTLGVCCPSQEYSLDPGTLEERTPAGMGEIPWLDHRAAKVRLPVTLLDQRNKVLWRAP